MGQADVADPPTPPVSYLSRLRSYIGFRLLLLALWIIPREYRQAIDPNANG